MENLSQYVKNHRSDWVIPEVNSEITHGDMPGDKVEIGSDHINKARLIFPVLLDEIEHYDSKKIVISVYGGSGVGKSEIASILAYYLREFGIGAYTMSGDNYPHRIPKFNDLERERVYQEKGIEGLREYLGSELEINFKEVNQIISLFKENESTIYLRRMGREVGVLWYEPVDFSNIQVLMLEWTHGNNQNLHGIDIPVFLNSTPEETLAHRKARNRDGKVDSPFTTLVLKLEQELLASQLGRAKIRIAKSGFLE